MSGLTREGCVGRQKRLCEYMSAAGLDAAVITDYRDIYYFTGALLPSWPGCLMVMADGRSWLAAQASDLAPVTDAYLTYEPHTYYTNNPDNQRLLGKLIVRNLAGAPKRRRIGWQAENMPYLIGNYLADALSPDEWITLDDTLAAMESRKDADEVELIRRSIRADLAAYDAAQGAIRPGVNELEVLASAQRAAMLDAGEGVYHGGDYRSGMLGGVARDRHIELGELFIVDAQTVFRGYWCDLSRAYSVGRQPTDLQQSIHAHIAAIQREVAGFLKPGLKGTDLWRHLDARIREHQALAQNGLVHHAGHGVGLRAHEAPDLNRDREGILEPGNIVSVEPGGYTDVARYGARIENMYLITKTGAENLSEYAMNLVPNTSN
jgi:Xaa-Pro aminopeptidase